MGNRWGIRMRSSGGEKRRGGMVGRRVGGKRGERLGGEERTLTSEDRIYS